jgi:hypothetical protein
VIAVARFVVDRSALDAIRRSEPVRVMLEVKAGKVLRSAEQLGAGVRRTGIYASSFTSDVRMDRGGWVGRVANTDWKAGLVEWGTPNSPKHRVLGRALDGIRS